MYRQIRRRGAARRVDSRAERPGGGGEMQSLLHFQLQRQEGSRSVQTQA